MKKFFKFIEIKTKITSIFPFFMTLLSLIYLGEGISPLKTAVFFAAMFLFDLTTTAINNYEDTKKNTQVLPYEREKAKAIMLSLFFTSTILGLWLFLLTDMVILLTGALCFFIGVIYTFGPVPLNAGPTGEFLSGLFYGFFIPFIILYINLPKGSLVELALSIEAVRFVIIVPSMVNLILLSMAPFMSTSNIMLANNICDVEKDVAVGRYTLGYYMKDKALILFKVLYIIPYLAQTAMVLFNILPVISLVSLITAIPVFKNVSVFVKNPHKETTFNTSIKNYILIMTGTIVGITVSVLF